MGNQLTKLDVVLYAACHLNYFGDDTGPPIPHRGHFCTARMSTFETCSPPFDRTLLPA